MSKLKWYLGGFPLMARLFGEMFSHPSLPYPSEQLKYEIDGYRARRP